MWSTGTVHKRQYIASWNHIQLAMFMDTAYHEGNFYLFSVRPADSLLGRE